MNNGTAIKFSRELCCNPKCFIGTAIVHYDNFNAESMCRTKAAFDGGPKSPFGIISRNNNADIRVQLKLPL